MRKTKLFIISTFCMVLLVLLTGCGKNKDSISAKEFSSKLENKNFTIMDSKGQLSDTDGIDDVYIAISSNYKYQIEFYKFSSESQAKSSYAQNKSRFENLKTNVSANTEVELANYSKYTLTSNGKYMVVSRIDDTLIYISADSNYKDDIDNILNDLGY